MASQHRAVGTAGLRSHQSFLTLLLAEVEERLEMCESFSSQVEQAWGLLLSFPGQQADLVGLQSKWRCTILEKEARARIRLWTSWATVRRQGCAVVPYTTGHGEMCVAGTHLKVLNVCLCLFLRKRFALMPAPYNPLCHGQVFHTRTHTRTRSCNKMVRPTVPGKGGMHSSCCKRGFHPAVESQCPTAHGTHASIEYVVHQLFPIAKLSLQGAQYFQIFVVKNFHIF